jgi:capsular polysaccharide transport system permease protein
MSDLGKFRRSSSSALDGATWIGPRGRIAALLRKWAAAFNIWLWVFVLLPTLLAGIYYFAIASDLYMAETKFVVRSQAQAPTSMLGTLLQHAGLVRSTDDTFSVQDFMLSRDAVRDLENRDHLRDIFNRPGADFITRFPNLFSGSTFEALYRHYGDFVAVTFDSLTGVSTLRVKAYRPEDAQAVATALLGYGEGLINKLNARAEHDSVELARDDVALAEQRLAGIQSQFTELRVREQILDPKLTTTGIYDTMKQVTAAQVTAQTRLAQLTKDSPGSPDIPLLRTRIAALDQQIAEAQGKVTGDGSSVAVKLADFERLSLDRELAEKALASASASLEQARIEAQRQQLYLERVVEPNLADYPLYPRRLVSFIMVLVSCSVAYGIAWLLIAGVREHAAR